MKLPYFSNAAFCIAACLALSFFSGTTAFSAAEEAGASSLPIFEPVFVFSLIPQSCTAGEGTSLAFSEERPLLSVSSAGTEELSLSVFTEAFDPSVLGKDGAALSLTVYINNINGFLDSSGYFRGGSVTLALPDIIYEWSLDDTVIKNGDNELLLNVRTAAVSYPQPEVPPEEIEPLPDETPADGEEKPQDSETADITVAPLPCTLTLVLKKLPSVTSASFLLRSAAIAAFAAAASDALPAPAPQGEEPFSAQALLVGIISAAAIIMLVFAYSGIKTATDARKKKNRKKKNSRKGV